MTSTRSLTAGLLFAVACLCSGHLLAGKRADLRIAVTIDDLPVVNATTKDLTTQREITRKLLAGLVAECVPAIGFVNEVKLRDEAGNVDPERVALLESWLEAGLSLGNHTYSHPSLHRTPLAAYQKDVVDGEAVTGRLLAARGLPLRFFRHPFLMTGRDLVTKEALVTWLRSRGYRVAPVTIDNSDWVFARAYDLLLADGKKPRAADVAGEFVRYLDRKLAYYERETSELLSREVPHILLLHASRLNADTFPRVAEMMRRRGYRFVSLEEALEDPAYDLPDLYVGGAGISWVHRWALTEGRPSTFFAGEPPAPPDVMRIAGVTEE